MIKKPRIRWAWPAGYTYPPNPLFIADCDYLSNATSINVPSEVFVVIPFKNACRLNAVKIRVDVGLPTDRPIDQVRYPTAFYFYVSNEIVPGRFPGYDTDWKIVSYGKYVWNQRYQEYSCVLQDCRWLAFRCLYQGFTLYAIHGFGDYIAPRFEFWNVNETEQLNVGEIPLIMPPAVNNVAYHQYLPFKIKNTDTVTHSYSLTIKPLRFGGDPVINDNFKLGKHSEGYMKSGTIVLGDLAPGAFSEELRASADIMAIDNPADWLHYFVIDGSETSPGVLNLYSIYGRIYLYNELVIGDSVFGGVGFAAASKPGDSAFGSVNFPGSMKLGDSIFGEVYMGGELVCGIIQ